MTRQSPFRCVMVFQLSVAHDCNKGVFMKSHYKLVFLASAIVASGMLGCGEDNCGKTEDSCRSENKVLDIDNCVCVAPQKPKECQKTQAYCEVQGKTLDTVNCKCVDDNSFPDCQKTQDECNALGKILDIVNCKCVDDNSFPDCQKTQDECNAQGKILDIVNCKCVDTPNPNRPSCQIGNISLSSGQKLCDQNNAVLTCLYDGRIQRELCKRGKCTNGECIVKECNGMQNGQHTCSELKLMVCHDGILEDAKPGCNANQICRDGDKSCSSRYKDCDALAHGERGCLDQNYVACFDGKLTTITDCTANGQFCYHDDDLGFICKSPTPVVCLWNDTIVPQGQTICDGNALKTCEGNSELNAGTDCADINPTRPICDLNTCREERSCGEYGDIAPNEIACNAQGTNKAKCIDGKLVDLTGADACTGRENATPICISTGSTTQCDILCKPGYANVDGKCEAIATCIGNKEVYVESTNSCACNSAAHYTGTPNACQCELGYYEQMGSCIAGCLYHDVGYNYGDAICSSQGTVLTCQRDGTMAESTCDKGVCVDGSCVLRSCGVVDNGKERCISGSLMTCDDGLMIAAKTPCTSAQLCLDGANACVDKKVCSATGSILDTATNTCICNGNNGWYGNGNSCSCMTTHVPLDGVCVKKQSCHASKETYNSKTNTCSCNTDAHWVGTAGSCVCESGYVQIGNTCKLKKTCNSNEIYNESTNTCSCDYTKHFVGSVGACRCENGFTLVEGVCELKKTCNSNEIYDASTNLCSCDYSKHFIGPAGACTCENGYVLIGNKCELKTSCHAEKETYHSATNTCTCNAEAHWGGTVGSCTCQSGYVEIGGVCQLKKTCNSNEIYDGPTNSCSCDNEKHFVGSAGACRCENGYVLIDSICHEVPSCDPVKQIYDNETNQCKCNEEQHWVDTAGACECDPNFTERDGECVAKPICDEQKEIYDATSNTCKCNVAAHWTGSAGSCTCAEGMSLCKGACVDVNTDVDHCGACSSPCSLSNECIGGKCLGPSNCNGGNHNTKDSIDHCGRCGNRCDDGTTCILGECVVGDGYTYCNGEKVRLNTPSHCNSCEPCSDGLICENNECLEGQGKMVCNNRVIDSRNDSANCSRCGNVCAQGLKCVDSECVRIDDITTSITCDGTTVNPSNDRLNCGGCGIYCLKCVNGACTQLNEGDTLYLGVYEGKPIQWQVIDKQIDMDSTDGYKYLVVTTKPLYSARYQENLSDNYHYLHDLYESQLFTWASSSLRRGLNNKLYSLFTTREVSLIVPTQIVDNEYCPLDDYKTLKSDSTTDRLFVLSKSEAKKLKKYNSNCDGQYGYLRAPICYSKTSSGKYYLMLTMFNCYNPSESPYSYTDYNDTRPVQPAMWIRIKRSN